MGGVVPARGPHLAAQTWPTDMPQISHDPFSPIPCQVLDELGMRVNGPIREYGPIWPPINSTEIQSSSKQKQIQEQKDKNLNNQSPSRLAPRKGGQKLKRSTAPKIGGTIFGFAHTFPKFESRGRNWRHKLLDPTNPPSFPLLSVVLFIASAGEKNRPNRRENQERGKE